MKRFTSFLVGLFFLALVPAVFAQTAPSQPSGEPFTLTGNFAASTNNTLKNGVQSTFEYSLAPRWQLRIDEITDLNGNLINLGEGQYKIPASALFGKKSPASFSNILIGVHAGLGAVKNSSEAVAFGAGAGFSVDYQVSSFFFVRALELTDVYSRGLSPNNQIFGNYNNVNIGAGIGFNF